jgi:enoyl-CoA hydratase/carnithine racemase
VSNPEPLVLVEHHADIDVTVVRLNRPKVNALNPALLAELAQVAENLGANPPGAVVITGNARAFAAGADIAEFGGQTEAHRIVGLFRAAFDAIAAIPRVTIAAVNGFALGGGCELALSCDLRVAGTSAVFGQPEILLGIIPGAGGTQRLPRLVGVGRAKEMIFSGRHVDATEALAIGLVNRVTADDQVVDHAVAWAAEMASGARLAQAAAKRCVDVGTDGSLSIGLSLEQELFIDVFGTEDAASGVASFLANGPGKATFVGR